MLTDSYMATPDYRLQFLRRSALRNARRAAKTVRTTRSYETRIAAKARLRVWRDVLRLMGETIDA